MNNEPIKKRGDKLYEKKKTAVRLEFGSDDESQAEDERVQLGKTPKKLKSPVPKSFKGPMPDEGVFDEYGKVRKRRPWTREEKDAIGIGVQAHGVGKWAIIKEDHGRILRNRTSVQIKDCWRTMERKGETAVYLGTLTDEGASDSVEI